MDTPFDPGPLPGAATLPRLGREEEPPRQPPPRHSTGGYRARTYPADRFGVFNAFADASMKDLTRAEIAVWLILWRDTKDGVARSAQTDIARRAGCSDRAVRTAIARLEELGLLEVVTRGSLGKGISTYRVFGLTPASSRGKLSRACGSGLPLGAEAYFL